MPGYGAQSGAQYSKFRWVVLVTLFVVTGTTALALISPAPLIGAISHSPGQTLSVGQITWMTMGWFNLATACAALVGGYFVDRLGFLAIFFAGMVLILVGWLLVPVIGDSYFGMMVIRLFQGIGTGPVMASSAAVAATRFPMKERSIVTGAQGAAMSAGLGLGQIFMPKILDGHGGDWAGALRSLWPVALVGLALTAIVAFGPKQPAAAQPALSAEEQAETKHALRHALAQPVTWAVIACVALMSWVFQAFNSLSPTYLSADAPLGIGLQNGSALLGYAQIANFLGAFAAGLVTERFLRGRVRPGLVISFALGAVFSVGMLLPAVTRSSGLMLVVLCVAAFLFAWVNPNALGYIAKNYPENVTGKLGGYAMGIGIFGGTAGVAAGSAALNATDHYTLSIVIMAAVCALGIVPAQLTRARKKSASVEPSTTDTALAA